MTPLMVVLTSLAALEPFDFFQPVEPPRTVQAMAHRGLWRIAPENSSHAIKACATHLVEWAEVDVRLSKDGAHVLIHNDDLVGATDSQGRVRELTLAELKRPEAGEGFARRFAGTKLLSFPEALTLAKGAVNLYVDCKEIDSERLVREIREAGMERQVVVYAGGATLAALERAIGSGSRVPLMKKWRPGSDGEDALETPRGLAAVEIDADRVAPEIVKWAKAKGLKVQAKALGDDWDKPEVWDRLIRSGVDWIQTDWPLEFQAYLHARNRPRPSVMISAHRGASRQAPENTLAAIEAAIAMKADYVELDVRTTKDGRFVLLHDAWLDRTTNGRGPVRDALFDDVRKLDAGAWFGTLYKGAATPTLDEALVALKGRAKFYCDAKDVAPEVLSAALRKYRMTADTAVYGGVAYQRRLKAVDPEIKRMPPLGRLEDLDRLAAELEPFAFDVSWRILSPELVARCHAKGILVFSDALGLNESVEQYRMAIEMKVDLIQTDFPERVQRAIDLIGRP